VVEDCEDSVDAHSGGGTRLDAEEARDTGRLGLSLTDAGRELPFDESDLQARTRPLTEDVREDVQREQSGSEETVVG
jgi:hypothetical protein